jgi:hypothetical protein
MNKSDLTISKRAIEEITMGLLGASLKKVIRTKDKKGVYVYSHYSTIPMFIAYDMNHYSVKAIETDSDLKKARAFLLHEILDVLGWVSLTGVEIENISKSYLEGINSELWDLVD